MQIAEEIGTRTHADRCAFRVQSCQGGGGGQETRAARSALPPCRPAWVRATPRGWPVVPDVYKMVATSPRAGGARSRGGASGEECSVVPLLPLSPVLLLLHASAPRPHARPRASTCSKLSTAQGNASATAASSGAGPCTPAARAAPRCSSSGTPACACSRCSRMAPGGGDTAPCLRSPDMRRRYASVGHNAASSCCATTHRGGRWC